MAGKIIIKQVRSKIGCPRAQHEALRGLGLRRIGQSVKREDNPSVRGQINVVSHLVNVEAVESGD